MPSELKLFRLFAVIIAAWLLLCIALARIVWSAQPTTYSLYVPVVTKPDCGAQSWKGLAGFEQGAIGASAMCEMHIGSVYQWQVVKANGWQSAYPLPQIVDMVKVSTDNIIFVQVDGLACGSDRVQCVAEALRGKGAVYAVFSNEPDGTDACCSDVVTPAQLAHSFNLIRVAVAETNPNVRWVCCNTLFPSTYLQQSVDTYHAETGRNLKDDISVWGIHVYPLVSNPPCHSPFALSDATCVEIAFSQVLMAQIATVHAIDPNAIIWVTEFGVDPFAYTANEVAATMLPSLCAQLKATAIERSFLFIGNRGILNASVMLADGSLSPIGLAYRGC